MATIAPWRNCVPSSSSPRMRMPRARTWRSSGTSAGTPGETTMRSWRRKVSRPWLPASTMMPSSRSCGSSATVAAGRESLTVTRAPRALRKRAAARPLLPSPTTSTRLFFRSTPAPLRGSGARRVAGHGEPCPIVAEVAFQPNVSPLRYTCAHLLHPLAFEMEESFERFRSLERFTSIISAGEQRRYPGGPGTAGRVGGTDAAPGARTACACWGARPFCQYRGRH